VRISKSTIGRRKKTPPFGPIYLIPRRKNLAALCKFIDKKPINLGYQGYIRRPVSPFVGRRPVFLFIRKERQEAARFGSAVCVVFFPRASIDIQEGNCYPLPLSQSIGADAPRKKKPTSSTTPKIFVCLGTHIHLYGYCRRDEMEDARTNSEPDTGL